MLKLKIQYFGHLLQTANSLEKTLMQSKIEDKTRGWQKMRWLDSITDSMDMNLSKFQEIVKDREAWYAAVHGIKKSWTRLSACIYLVALVSVAAHRIFVAAWASLAVACGN